MFFLVKNKKCAPKTANDTSYTSNFWAPYTENLGCLSFVTNDNMRTSNATVMRENLGWDTMDQRASQAIMMYHMVHRLVNIPGEPYLTLSIRRTRGIALAEPPNPNVIHKLSGHVLPSSSMTVIYHWLDYGQSKQLYYMYFSKGTLINNLIFEAKYIGSVRLNRLRLQVFAGKKRESEEDLISGTKYILELFFRFCFKSILTHISLQLSCNRDR